MESHSDDDQQTEGDPNSDGEALSTSSYEDSDANNVSEDKQNESEGSVSGSDCSHYAEHTARKRKIKKSANRAREFLLEEAEVDDGDNDEFSDGDIDDLHVDETQMARDHGPTARDIENRHRLTTFLQMDKEDEITNYLRERYSTEIRESNSRYQDGDVENELHSQSLLPSIRDPSLFILPCKPGLEQETCLLLMHKFLCYNGQFQVKSIVHNPSAKGYIYIEAFKKTHFAELISGVSALKIKLWGEKKLVDIADMPDILRVVKSEKLMPDAWVRLKTGKYKNDLAKVVEVCYREGEATIMLVPRIDYNEYRPEPKSTMSDDADGENLAKKGKKQKKRRPEAMLLKLNTLEEWNVEVRVDGNFYLFRGDKFTKDGYLQRSVKINSLVVKGVNPSFTELLMFESTLEKNVNTGAPIVNMSEENNFEPVLFEIGETVEVAQGELKNLQGSVVNIQNSTVTITPKHDELKDALEFPCHELQKVFRLGDHVMVTWGPNQNATGLVLKVCNDEVIICSDSDCKEIRAMPKHLQICSTTTPGFDPMGTFQWGDLVSISHNTVGVVINMCTDDFQVLSMEGSLINVKPASLTHHHCFSRATTLDIHDNHLQIGDIVVCIDGKNVGKSGRIKYIYRSFVFFESQDKAENGGLYAAKSRSLQLEGGLIKSLEERQEQKQMKSEQIEWKRSKKKDMELVGKTVKIFKGVYKGYVGILRKIITDEVFSVELHSGERIININRCHVMFIDSESQGTMGKTGSYYRSYSPYPRCSVPRSVCHGSYTPLQSCSTPAHSILDDSPVSGGCTPNPWNPKTKPMSPYSPAMRYTDPHSPTDPLESFAGLGRETSYDASPTSPSFTSCALSPSDLDCPYTPQTLNSSECCNSSVSVGTPSEQSFVGTEMEPELCTSWVAAGLYANVAKFDTSASSLGLILSASKVFGAMISMLESQETIVIKDLTLLKPAVPRVGDNVQIICGDVGLCGVLVAVDLLEGIVRVSSGDVRMVQLKHLCRAKPTK